MIAAPYVALLSVGSLRRLLLAALIARVATATLGLALLLALHDHTGSYAIAGFAVMCRAFALAAAAPWSGRIADRLGVRRAIGALTGVHAAAYGLLIVLLATNAPAVIMIAAATAVGLSTPPITPVLRASWPELVSADELPAAYALDGVSNEVAFVAGPLLVALTVGSMSATQILALAGGAVVSGALLLRNLLADRDVIRSELPPLRGAVLGGGGDGRWTAIMLCALWGAFAYGVAEVLAVFAADRDGGGRTAGVALGALAVGSVVGGLVAGHRCVGRRGALTWLYVIGAALAGLAGFASAPMMLTATYLAIGLVAGPRDILEQAIVADLSRHDRAVEAFGWFGTFTWAGYSLGAAAAGLWASAFGSSPALLGSGACLLAAAAGRSSAAGGASSSLVNDRNDAPRPSSGRCGGPRRPFVPMRLTSRGAPRRAGNGTGGGP